MIRGGDTFLRRSPTKKHLWVVISYPELCPRDPVVIVSLVSCSPYTEQTCILNPGDHPFIKHGTAVYYRAVQTYSIGRIRNIIASDDVDSLAPMEPDVLARIRGGALQSPTVSQEICDLLIRQGLEDD